MRPILAIIVISQFFCTSLWFAGNAVVGEIGLTLQAGPQLLAHITSAVQFGFIAGTLCFAIAGIADRFAPSRIFFACACFAGFFNLVITMDGLNINSMLICRFFTGFFLAGIYPVGMKIAADYFQQGLGRSLGFLVGALVLGTAFPHVLKASSFELPWKYVIYATSLLSLIGGLLILLLVPNGPNLKKAGVIQLGSFMQGFRHPPFRAVSFGYFGHMWELYTFWAFVPFMLEGYQKLHPTAHLNIPLLSFLIIAIGAPACVIGGILSQKTGAYKVACTALSGSLICCLVSPFFFSNAPAWLFIFFLFTWGILVIADSPMFSAMVARHAPVHSKGTSLTIVTCIGFTITILSIQCLGYFKNLIPVSWLFWLLGAGPVLGLWALVKNRVQIESR